MQLIKIRDKGIRPHWTVHSEDYPHVGYRQTLKKGSPAQPMALDEELAKSVYFGCTVSSASLRRKKDGTLTLVKEEEGDDKRALVHAIFTRPLLGTFAITAAPARQIDCPHQGERKSFKCGTCGEAPVARSRWVIFFMENWSEHPMSGTYPVWDPLESCKGVTVLDEQRSSLPGGKVELLVVLEPGSGIRVVRGLGHTEHTFEWDGKSLHTNFSDQLYPAPPPDNDPGTLI